MSRKKETLTLSIPPGTKERLEAIARRFNIFWGKSPSPSGLITAIADETLAVGEPFTLTSVQVQSLKQAIEVLVSSGKIEEAQTLIELLLDKGNLEEPLRNHLLTQVNHVPETWRRAVKQQIQEKKPFILVYKNSQEQVETLTILYAEIKLQEKRFYLQGWCEETEGSPEIPELIHNRCFRLDRIVNLQPINKPWRESLDSVKVQVQFRGRLVKAYEPNEDDLQEEDRVVDGIRLVTRKVTNTFWFFRQISLYWEDCEVMAPPSVRERMRNKVKAIGKIYQ